MKTIGLNRQECIENLQTYLDDIEKIESLFKDKHVLSGAVKNDAQTLMRKLKQRLKDDYKLHHKNREKKRMTYIEERNYYPAISEATAFLTVKWNSVPDAKWCDNLYQAKSKIEWALDQLNKIQE
jgi:hypothetical protein